MNLSPHSHTVKIDKQVGAFWHKWYVQYGDTKVYFGRTFDLFGDKLSPRLVEKAREATLTAIRRHDEGSKRAKVDVGVDRNTFAANLMNELRLGAFTGQWASERIAAEREIRVAEEVS